jgi:GTPase SAR1 family protein
MSFQVVVVGLPNSGRTSLMKYLKYSRVSEDDQIEEPVTI